MLFALFFEARILISPSVSYDKMLSLALIRMIFFYYYNVHIHTRLFGVSVIYKILKYLSFVYSSIFSSISIV